MKYIPVYQPSEKVGFYANFDDALTSDTSAWQISIVDNNFDVQISNITAIRKNMLSDTEYHFYCQFTMPSLAVGCYRYIIEDTGTGNVIYVSSLFQVASTSELADTLPVRYRSKGNIFEYYYEYIPDFFNQLRLHLLVRQPQHAEKASGFETTKGVYYRTLSVVSKLRNIITKWFDEPAHEAFHAMTTHSTLLIDDVSYRRNEDSSYEENFSENSDYPLADGQITLEVVDYARQNQDC